jgi:hypothetical protein
MSKTIELNNETLELITDGQSCEVCHLASMEKPKNGEVAKCVELTFGLCLKPGCHFSLKNNCCI